MYCNLECFTDDVIRDASEQIVQGIKGKFPANAKPPAIFIDNKPAHWEKTIDIQGLFNWLTMPKGNGKANYQASPETASAR